MDYACIVLIFLLLHACTWFKHGCSLAEARKKKSAALFLSQAQGIIKPGLSAAKRYVHIDGMKPLAKIVGEFARIAALFFLLPACILGS